MRHTATLLTLLLVAACGRPAPREPITIYAAASLARPLAQLTAEFERRTGVGARVELGGSIEHARKITDLGRIPDVLLLADDEVVAALAPTHIDWYVRFATNRLVVAYAQRSPHADSITGDNWWRILSREGVRVGRADPAIAPAGRHALALIRRLDTYYQSPGATDRMLARATLRYVRPNATELAALLATGEVDYILDYDSVARQYGFQFVALPEDLAIAILYGMAIPRQALGADEATEFAAFMLSESGRRILREANVTVLPTPVAVGSNLPDEIKDVVRTTAITR